MTLSNRFINRLLLLVIGLVALAGASLLAMHVFPRLAELAGLTAVPWMPVLPDLADAATLWWLAGGVLLVIVLAVAWIATRGRGRTSQALSADGVVVDDSVVAGILRAELDGDPDVLAVSAQGYRRAAGVVMVAIETRTRADLGALLAHVRAAVAVADARIGIEVPLVIHLTQGIRTLTSGSRITK